MSDFTEGERMIEIAEQASEVGTRISLTVRPIFHGESNSNFGIDPEDLYKLALILQEKEANHEALAHKEE